MFYSNVNKIFLGTDGAASSRVGQILSLRVEGSIPYSAPLINFYHKLFWMYAFQMAKARQDVLNVIFLFSFYEAYVIMGDWRYILVLSIGDETYHFKTVEKYQINSSPVHGTWLYWVL